MPPKDTPPQKGLTTDPTETGIVHDVFSWPGKTVWYLTERERVAVQRRAARRGQPEQADLDELSDRLRTQRRQNRGALRLGRKVG